MHAGLAKRQLRLRDIFSSTMSSLIPKQVIFVFFKAARPVTFTARRMALAA
jgi:hypothetical protein